MKGFFLSDNIKLMYNHAPKNYQCPICLAVRGIENDDTWIKQDDIFYKDDLVIGLINSKFIKGNEGHAIIVPREHFENIYDLPRQYGTRIMEVAQAVAVAIREIRKSDGITIQQNNEPAGGQHAFHYHLHIVPRFNGDKFYEESLRARKSLPEERVAYAQALRNYFIPHPLSL